MHARVRHVGIFGAFSVVAAGAWAIVRSPVSESVTLPDSLLAMSYWPVRPGDWHIDHLSDAGVYMAIGRLLSVDSPYGLLRLGLVTSLLAIAGLMIWVAAASTGDRWRAARLAVLGPVTTVVVFWLGFYDAFTVLCWALMLFAWWSGRWWLLLAGSIPLGFQHFEQTILGTLALWLAWLAWSDRVPDRLRRANPLLAVAGVLIGKGLLAAVMLLNGQTIEPRSRWLELYLLPWMKTGLITTPILVWSLFAGLWGLVVAQWLRTPGMRPRALLASAAALGLVGQVLSADRPRVFVIIELPALLLAIVVFVSSPDIGVRERRLVESIAWLAPPILLWGVTVANVNIADTAIPAWLHVLGIG